MTDETPASAASARHRAYWRANLRLMTMLLIIWFVVSFGFGILLVEPLNRIDFFGFKFGFWWAQQGAIYVFVVLVFVYRWQMTRIDRRFGLSDVDLPAVDASAADATRVRAAGNDDPESEEPPRGAR